MQLFFVLFSALILRLISINQSLCFDEAIVARVVSQYSFFEIVKNFSIYDFHPPLYYLFVKFWTSIFGFSEISLRFPSIIFSLVAGLFVYKIGKAIKNEKLGFWSMIFFLFNPLIVYYSQEARMYMMTTMFLTIAFYYFLKIKTKESKLKNLFLMNFFLILSFFTFYGSIFFITSVLIYLLYKKQFKKFFISLSLIFFSFLTIFTLFYQQFINAKISLNNVLNWSLVLGKANIKNLLLLPIKFLIGRISFYPKHFYWLSVFFVFIFFADVIKNYYDFYYLKDKNKKYLNLLLYFILIPVLIGFFISFFIPMFSYFRFLYIIPFLSVYLSLITIFTKEKFNYYVLFLFLFFSLLYLIVPVFHREDWKGLGNYLNKKNINNVYMIKSSSDPLAYYNKKIKINDLRDLCNNNFLIDKKIFIIPYTSEIWGIDYNKCLLEKQKNLFSIINFRELTLKYYR